MEGYQPTPLDTSRVELSAEILQLTELLARHTHEVWAQQRLAEGWRHGPHRDDARKEHPCLVSYERLSQSDRDYDRIVSMQILKAVLALGYRISKT
jgi:hypothetical protein